MTMHYDDILKNYIGEFGVYQAILLLAVSYLVVPGCFSTFDYIFVGVTPDFRCDVGDVSHLESNFSRKELLQLISPQPKYGDPKEFDSCQMYDRNYSSISVVDAREIMNDTNNSVIPCTKWIYSQEIFTSTIVTEWDLVCDREWVTLTSQAIYMTGKFGIFFGGWMADRYGRRGITLAMIVVHILSRLAAVLAPDYVIFMIARFFMSVSGMNIYSLVFIIAIEMVGPNWRSFAGQVPYIICSISYIVLGNISYFIRGWRMLYWTLLLISAPSVLYFCFLPESIRWLLSKERYIEAKQLMAKVARINRRNLPPEECEKHTEEIQKVRLWHTIWKSTYLIKITAILVFLWLTIVFTYFALLFYIPKLGGNIFINAMISGAMEIPALLFVKFTFDTRLGRRLCTSSSFIINGIALLAIIIVPKDMNWLVITLALLGRFLTTYTFSAVYIFTSELYPTPIRAAALTFCSTVSRFGGVVSPYIVVLKKVYIYLPEIIFGVLTISAGLLTLLLRETAGENLLENLTEIGVSSRNKAAKALLENDVPLSEQNMQNGKIESKNVLIYNTDI